MKDRITEWLWRHFVALVAILCLLIYAFTYLEDCFGPPIRADGAGYYAYLPSWFIHGDMTFIKLADAQFQGSIPAWTGLTPSAATGGFRNKYNIGVAVMMTPFFFAGHVLTWWMRSPPGGFEWWKFNHPLDGYSLFYQHAAGLAGVFYMVVGLAVLRSLLATRFTKGVVLSTMATLLLGTNLLHYGSGETVFSSAYSFFLFCCFLWVVERWYREGPNLRQAALLGMLSGLVILVRLNNILFLAIFALYGITRTADIGNRIREWCRQARPLAVAVLAAVLTFLPQVVVWRATTGAWLTYSYGSDVLHFGGPRIPEVLFSLDRGLFFWFPGLLLAVAGLIPMARRAREYILPAVCYLPMHLYLVASWSQWQWGGSFGHRAFVEDYSLLALPLASLYASRTNRTGRMALVVLSLAAIAWCLFFMKLYYTRELSYYGLDAQALFDILWLRKEAALAFLRRLVS